MGLAGHVRAASRRYQRAMALNHGRQSDLDQDGCIRMSFGLGHYRSSKREDEHQGAIGDGLVL
jgi:hypothetical protein